MRNQHINEQNELNTCKLESQDATKITSGSADSHFNFSWKMMSLLVRTMCLCLALMTIFLYVSVVTMALLRPIGVGRVNRWTRDADQRREDFYCEALASSRHNVDLVFDEETMKPEKLTKAAENCRKRSKCHEN